MEIDVAHSHTLGKLQREILATLELTGPLMRHLLVMAVQLSNFTKMDYRRLLTTAIYNATVTVLMPRRLFSSYEHHNVFERVLNSSAYSEAQVDKEIDFLEKLELVRHQKNKPSGFTEVCLTSEGERLAHAITAGRIPLVRPPKEGQSSIFFAGAFGRDDIDMLYSQELEPACQELGYSMYRVDIREPFQAITSSILSGIQNSACILADLTYSRPSVYFEIGVAHGLGIPLVLTCRDDHFRSTDDNLRVHFDLEQYKTSFWSIGESDRKFHWPKLMQPIERLRGILQKSPTPTR